MEYKLIPSEKFKSVSWSGGTTTQLYIYPETANYKQLNFDFRLSTATVEVEKSEFTELAGVSRQLMILDGATTLFHANRYSKRLNKFEVDKFEGDWQTTSVGKCTDFNLMTIGETTGELSALVVEKDQVVNHKIKGQSDWLFIYVFSGKVNFTLSNKLTELNKGDLLVVSNLNISNFDIEGVENSELVITNISI